MSSSLSSGGAYRLEALDLDVIKSPSTSWISNSSSPSSTLPESSNCPRAISTRKPRTLRKRPNQTYNEAAAILSTAYPKIFPTTKPSTKFSNSHDHNYSNTFLFEPSGLLMPFKKVDMLDSQLLLDLEKPVDIKGLSPFEKPCRSPPEIDSSEEFDAESILDEEIGGGIESIMGNPEMEKEKEPSQAFCYGYPVGLELGYGLRRESRAGNDWWKFPCVNVVDVNPNVESKKKNKVEIRKLEETEDSVPKLDAGLLLSLNYDGVLHAWSDKPSPFSGESEANDVRARLAQIDLFSDSGGVRKASVLRYKEKRRTRLFSKKIRYQVRKVNADRRPRMKVVLETEIKER